MDYIPFDVTPRSKWQTWLSNAKFWRDLGAGRVIYYCPVVWLNGHKAFEWLQLCVICEWRFTWLPGRCVCKHCLKG
jgi:hypothetical protein